MTDAFSERLAGEVRARRRSLGLAQRDLAGLAGLSERFVRSVEQGKPSVQLDSVLALLGTLGLELQLITRPSAAAQTGAQPAAQTGAQPAAQTGAQPDAHPRTPREDRP
ncbi:helix-turn-helix transcriptional regulator [Arthrobacter sp. PAMC25284]|uniref:helix-turn-helix transcriptional regulator n=1 Tax=Arthrobacter sp. PAMC25284 TaxID=2861279 RepID=UPI001C62503E|nr:helix-turn-helix transcriptional regulator [Arthrobacter sp. PAMC25284]QYF88987.1 helix-turn-helix transcriptional regulator [Arthrobacter sp. PAMC25284]